jgi:hypothetical protein
MLFIGAVLAPAASTVNFQKKKLYVYKIWPQQHTYMYPICIHISTYMYPICIHKQVQIKSKSISSNNHRMLKCLQKSLHQFWMLFRSSCLLPSYIREAVNIHAGAKWSIYYHWLYQSIAKHHRSNYNWMTAYTIHHSKIKLPCRPDKTILDINNFKAKF